MIVAPRKALPLVAVMGHSPVNANGGIVECGARQVAQATRIGIVMGKRLDTILLGFHETHLPDAFARFPADHPLGFYYRTTFLRIHGQDVEPHVALSRMNNQVSGRDGFYHWSEAAPLALHHLTTFLRRHGFGVEMIRFLPGEHARLAELLAADPASVSLSTTFYMDPAPVLDAVSFIRRHNQRVKIIVGGPFVQDVLRETRADSLGEILEILGGDVYVRSSAGEVTLARVLSALRDKRELGSVPNLVLVDGEGRLSLTARASEDDATECHVAWELLSDDELGTAVNLRTSISCPFACEFCEFPVRAGAHRVADLAVVEEQLRVLARRGVRYVCFVDDTLNSPFPRFQELCRLLSRRELGFRWAGHFRASGGKHPALFRQMRDSGCSALHLGIESGDSRMLGQMNKSASLSQYERTIEQCNENEILTHAALVIGFPGETEESLENTVRFINRTEPTTFKAQPFFYHHHAPVRRRASELELRGKGWHWRHATMNSSEAMRAAHRVRAGITGSRHVGDRQMHIFMLPWLLSKGMRREELLEALTLFDRIQRRSFEGESGASWMDKTRANDIAKLEALAAGLRLEPARYSFDDVSRYREDLATTARKRRAFHALQSDSGGTDGRRLVQLRK